MVYSKAAEVRTTFYGDFQNLRESKLPFYLIPGVKTTFEGQM
jgi:hypothetical protein